MRASAKQPQGDKIVYEDFLGISNAKDVTRVPKGYLLRAVNFDVDVEMMLHRRRGFTKKLPIGSHSLWSNEFVCFFVSGGDFYRLNDDWTYSVVLPGIGSNRMVYTDVNGVIYFSNNQIIGYIQDGVAYPFPPINQTYKVPMTGGSILEFYNSRLYAVQDDTIFFSDAGRPMVMDNRHNFVQLSGKIRMLQAVVDGLYVSAGEHVFFMHGDGKDDPPKWKYIPIIDVPAFEGMSIKVEGEKISPKIEAKVIIWAGCEGMFCGKPAGEFDRLSGRNLFLDGVSHGTAALLVRSLHGNFHPGYPTTSGQPFTTKRALTADILVVGGGGGAGMSDGTGGPGGAGGLIYEGSVSLNGTYAVVIGAGGLQRGDIGTGYNGSDSTFGTLLTSKGGGGGCGGNGGAAQVGAAGGSGGGSGYLNGSAGNDGGTETQTVQSGDSGTYGFGNDGGDGSVQSGAHGTGGGGGAGAAGDAGSTSVGGAGGVGKQYDISGVLTYYAGGGGGGCTNASGGHTPGLGGSGGGGNGSASASGTPGTDNTGGGGGGGAYNTAGVAGGSGIVIIRYL